LSLENDTSALKDTGYSLVWVRFYCGIMLCDIWIGKRNQEDKTVR